MFKVGDTVVHPKHGAGTVVKYRTIQHQDHEQKYFCIELTDGRGSVMIPVERVAQSGLREPLKDTTLIQEVMEHTPEVLVDDPRMRQSAIEEKINSGSIELIIQALRDLCWRETVSHLSPTDKKLKDGALSKILQELALNPVLVIATVKLNIEAIIQQSMQLHLPATQSG